VRDFVDARAGTPLADTDRMHAKKPTAAASTDNVVPPLAIPIATAAFLFALVALLMGSLS
jgi:hypothetical protein